MIYTEDTKQGVISINKVIINQLIQEAFKPWNGKVHISNAKTISSSNKGLYLEFSFSAQIGESLSLIFNSVMDFLVESIKGTLELEIDDIVINLDSIFTQKGTGSKRNIIFRYSDKEAGKEFNIT